MMRDGKLVLVEAALHFHPESGLSWHELTPLNAPIYDDQVEFVDSKLEATVKNVVLPLENVKECVRIFEQYFNPRLIQIITHVFTLYMDSIDNKNE